MRRVFVDTSAILALLVPSDLAHSQAQRIFERLRFQAAPLVTTSYVLLEIYALLGRRLGLSAVRTFREEFSPLLDVFWVEGSVHDQGLDLLLERSLRDLSLVDCVSFVVLRREAIEEIFAFDGHFEDEGFETLA